MAQTEVLKLQQHLKLLKEQYAQIQNRYNDLEAKYQNLSALSQSEEDENSFTGRLLTLLKNLYGSQTYSDIKIRFKGKEVSCHKIVLNARSDDWNETFLSSKDALDWEDVEVDVGESIIHWLYTNEINLLTNDLTLKVLVQAHEFKLLSLMHKCEEVLTENVTVNTCVKFYTVAEQIGAVKLREFCSEMISIYWNELKPSDFEDMSGALLTKMLKEKTPLPLHSAVRLLREDVIFLLLIENASKLSDIVNLWSPEGELLLDMALRARNSSIATTLIQHNADINIRDNRGDTLLHRAIKKDDAFSALFLLENNCDATLTTRSDNDTSLHLLAGSHLIEESEKIANKLINRNVNVNAQNRQGYTALHIAIMADNRPIFDVLLPQPNLELNLRNQSDHTPIYYALSKYECGDRDDANYASELLKAGAQPDPIDSKTGDSLLQILLEESAREAAIFLTRHVTNVNHVNLGGETALHTGSLMNYADFVERLLDLGANPNMLTVESRQNPLHYAARGNAADCINVFIDYNEKLGEGSKMAVNFNARDVDGDTPLSLALSLSNKSLVPLLIKGKADVNVRNGKDFTLLHQAILKEDGVTAIFLLDNGADINAKTAEYETPLQLAIHCRLGEVVDALCVRGVDMSAGDRLGNCALWAALDSGQDDIASILVRHGADTDCWGPGPEGCRQTLLHRAIDENKEPAAIFLIQAGCDLDSPRMEGPNGEGGDEAKDKASPLHLCCQWGLEPVVQTLVEHGANVNSRDVENKTPLHVAIENQHDAIISLLLRVPEIDLSLRDKSGLSPFATALTFRNNKAAQAILDKLPTAAEQFDSKGQNFLHIALKKGDLESVLFLLSVHVDVNSRVQDSTMSPPLHLAARNGNETLVRSLLLAGARIEDTDAHKRTALHVASEAGNASVVSALLQNNTNFDAVDCNGDNALHVAVKEGHINVVRVLLTESAINAEAVNIKGRNPLHELCQYGKENAAAICELFIECMPTYPIDKPDLNGNTPLLIAYMKGNGNLCRVLVKSKASLAIENRERVTIFNYQVATKQLLYRLLDQLSEQTPWTWSTDMCQECGKSFTLTIRRHHCRHCGRVLCGKCSDQEVPIIKFGENKPVRVCKICFDVLKTGVS